MVKPVNRYMSTSGVICSFNHEDFIEEAILGLIEQVDEVVVVDDQSTDDTLNKLMTLKQTNPKLKVISPLRKLGVSGAYNLAIQEAKHEILVMQGADDVSLPDRVNAQLNILKDAENIISCSPPLIINRYSHTLPNESAPEFFGNSEHQSVLARLFFNGNYICAPSVSMRREDFIRLGGFFRNIDALQDYALWLKCASIGKIHTLSYPVVKYRKHGSNLSRKDYSEKLMVNRSSRELLFILENFISKANTLVLRDLLNAAMEREYKDPMDPMLIKILIKLRHVNFEFRLSAIKDLLEYSQVSSESDFELRKYSDLVSLISRVSRTPNFRLSPFELHQSIDLASHIET